MNFLRLVCIPCFCCAWAVSHILEDENSNSHMCSLSSRFYENDNRFDELTELIYDWGDGKSIEIVARRKSSGGGRKRFPCNRRITGSGTNARVTRRAQKQRKSSSPCRHKRGTALLRSAEGTFRVHKIYGDGNCVFRAVSYILWGNEDEHRALRALVTRHIRNHWWEYGPFVIAEWNITSPEEYSNFMMNEGVFATELECTVATKLHKMNLSIYREIDDGHGDDVKRVFHNRANNSYGTARLLFSGRSESGHYDVLFLER